MSKIPSSRIRSITLRWTQFNAVLGCHWHICTEYISPTLSSSQTCWSLVVWSLQKFNIVRFQWVRCRTFTCIKQTNHNNFTIPFICFSFIRHCGKQVTHLRLNSVKFLSSDSLETVGLICENLRELSLRNASISRVTGNPYGRFKNLERLDLFRVDIAEQQIMLMLQNNPNLKHINLAFSQANMDQIAITISKYNVHMQSIDMWKSRGLSSIGLRALAANCYALEEVDFGWWYVNNALCSKWKNLMKHFDKLIHKILIHNFQFTWWSIARRKSIATIKRLFKSQEALFGSDTWINRSWLGKYC